MEVIKGNNSKSTFKMNAYKVKAYYEGFQQVQNIVHLSNLWATYPSHVRLVTLNKYYLGGNSCE
ncbi:hypothetical protein JHK85_053768 [Glycine max]|nr:hypothetical protein JHK86_052909 [Glycine max]KAG4927282.1 hypothetical protein JHK85_053768 [Glycine max]